jgi:hypothetical protein
MSELGVAQLKVLTFRSLEGAIKWHNVNCNPEYGLTVNFNLEDVMPVEEKSLVVETYTRKVFEVQAIKVDETNMEQVAKWCGGTVSSTKLDVPFIDVPNNNAKNQMHSRAFVGSWVVTGREGHFSSYADRTFHRTFERS